MKKSKIVYLELTKIYEYKNNPRQNDGAVDAVANSIKEFGFRSPIIIDGRNNEIVCGHTRYKASKKLGIETVPCIVIDDLNEEQIRAYRIADNSTSELAEWDNELLTAELSELTAFDFVQFGLNTTECDCEIKEDNFDVDAELSELQVCNIGDVWQLGKHRVMCGDSTNSDNVTVLMKGAVADLVVTDPPYNVDYEGKTKDALKINNDKMNDNNFKQFLEQCFGNISKNLKDGGCVYCFCVDSEISNFINAIKINNIKHHETLIWVKNTMVLGHLDYHKQHEPCIYGWKLGSGHYFTDDRTQTTVFEDKKIDFKKLKKDEAIKMLQEIFKDKTSTTIIHENKPSRNVEHPTMKPIKLLARIIKNSSKPQELVLDPFLGSGSTLIACEQLNRICYGMELDPKYVDVIIKRWEKFTGNKAVLICQEQNQ